MLIALAIIGSVLALLPVADVLAFALEFGRRTPRELDLYD